MSEEKLARINELYKKSKEEGLTEIEAFEQKKLRQEFMDDFRQNLKGQLDNIRIVEPDGTITNPKDNIKNKDK